jgi:hypothetical protein
MKADMEEKEKTFATPEEAALAGLDYRYARVFRVTFNSPDETVVELAHERGTISVSLLYQLPPDTGSLGGKSEPQLS